MEQVTKEKARKVARVYLERMGFDIREEGYADGA